MTSPKFFSTKTLSKAQLRTLICEFAAKHRVKKVSFNNKAKSIDGSYNFAKDVIFISSTLSKRGMLLTFFHELSHHIKAAKRRFLDYHLNAATPKISPSAKFNIENGIDKLAQKLWQKNVDTKQWGKYRYGYPRSNRKHLTEWLGDRI